MDPNSPITVRELVKLLSSYENQDYKVHLSLRNGLHAPLTNFLSAKQEQTLILETKPKDNLFQFTPDQGLTRYDRNLMRRVLE